MNSPVNNEFNILREEILRRGRTPKQRLRALISTLASWSEDSEKKQLVHAMAIKLDSQDVVILRDLILEQVDKLKLKNSQVIADQILFIVIGAIKFQVKRDSITNPWKLAELSLNSVLEIPSKTRFNALNLILIGSFLLLASAIFIFNHYNIFEKSSTRQELPTNHYVETTQPIPSPFVPSHFYSLRDQMGRSVCQIPQAATLPAEQRAAFLTFLSTGQIEMRELSNLQAALSLVHCEYIPLTLLLNH